MNCLYVTIGCLLKKQVHESQVATVVSRHAKREFATGQLTIPRPENGITEHLDTCPCCRKPLHLVVRSWSTIVGGLMRSVLLWVGIPIALALILRAVHSPTLEIGSNPPLPLWGLAAMFALTAGIVKLAHLTIYYLDFKQGNATAALEWSEEFRKSDFREKLGDFKHEILSVKVSAEG